jgi:hypothetical protein
MFGFVRDSTGPTSALRAGFIRAAVGLTAI